MRATRNNFFISIVVSSFLFGSTAAANAQVQVDQETLVNACQSGQWKTVTTILNDSNDLQLDGIICLIEASDQPRVIDAAVRAGVDPSPPVDYLGAEMTPLTWHAFGGRTETVRALLQHGADPNIAVQASEALGGTRLAPLDVVLSFIYEDMHGEGQAGKDYEPYYEIQELLDEYGAKRYQQMQSSQEL